MFRQAIATLRAIRLACHLAYGALLASGYPLFALSIRKRILRRWSRELLEILQVKLEIEGASPAHCMLVANHVSWLDVIAINAVHPSCFIAKSEVRDWPLLGTLCRQARTVFIERNIRRDTLRINGEIGKLLTEGESVALFPEGTSTNGIALRHFHSSLFQSAIDFQAAIQPVVVRYHDGSGRHCADAAFIDDMSFLQSLRKVLLSPALHVSLNLLPRLSCYGEDRRSLADKAQAAISTALDEQMRHRTSPIPNKLDTASILSAYSLLLDPIFKLKKRTTADIDPI